MKSWGLPLLLAALATVGLWALLGRAVDLPPAPEPKLHCVSYTPFRGDQTPYDPSLVIPRWQIEEDLRQLQPITNCVRIYAVDQGLDQVVPIAEQLGMQVLLGIWISSEPAKFEPQIVRTIELANAHRATVKAIIVGNEVLLRGEQSGETLAALVNHVKQATGLPTTYADVWGFWQKAPPVLAESVDFLTIHILPYWEDDPAPSTDAVVHLEYVMGEMQRQFPGRRLMIGETGWPSAGRAREDAVPSIVDQARYLRDFLVYAKAHELDYNFIEAYDQPWKRHQEGAVGGYWGLFDAARQAKFDWFTPVSNHPNWPMLAGLSVLIGLIALALARPRALTLPAGAVFSAAAMAGGVFMVLEAERALLITVSYWDMAVEALLLLQAAIILLVVLRQGSQLDKGPSFAEAPLRDAVAWLKAMDNDPIPLGGLLRLVVLVGAATVGLALAFDGRYRGFPLAAYAFPALAFVALQIRRGSFLRPDPAGTEERILSLIFVASALYIAWAEGPLNWQALAWCGLLLLFALGTAGAWRGQRAAGVSAGPGASG
jgi:exo-beta-1,3-glucanase (GH17 family)